MDKVPLEKSSTRHKEKVKLEFSKKTLGQSILSKIAYSAKGIIISFRLRPDGSMSFPFATDNIIDIYGIKPEDIVNDASPIFNLVHPEDSKHVQEEIEYSAKTMTPWHGEYRFLHPIKGEIWVEGRSMPELEEDGSILWTGFIHDITERKLADQSLHLWGDAFQNCAHGIAIGSAITNRIVTCNPAFAKLHKTTVDQIEGRFILSLYDQSQHEYVKSKINEADLLGQVTYESVMKSTDGTTFPVQIDVVSVRNNIGQITYRVATLQDITQRKKAEERLHSQEILLREMGKIAQVGGWEFDPITGKGLWTDEVAHIHDVDPLIEPNKEFGLSFYHEDSRNQIEKAVEEAIRNGTPYDLELKLVSATNKLKWVRTICSPIVENGKVIKVRGSIQDITERKLVEEELWKSQLHLLASQHIARVGSWELDLTKQENFDKNPLIWSDECFRIFGYEPNKLSINEELFWNRVHPDDKSMLEQAVEQAIEKKSFYETEHRIILDDKSERIIHERGEIIVDPKTNQAITFIGTAQDITQRKQVEEELRQIANDLARSNADLEQFAYVASHDLQEPLRAVVGCVQILQRRYQGQLDDRADELITHIIDGASRMQKLIEDLLVFSRVGTRGKQLSPVNSSDALNLALSNLATAIKESHAVITYDPLPIVNADSSQLTSLFQNLISNAIKFCRNHSPQIHIKAECKENKCIFSVSDNGIGIESQYFERIFGVFQRLHTRKEYPGTGIGLAICKKIIERHGGNIWVESTLNQGSTFFFTLPFAKDIPKGNQ
jgi:PAS domain S-box-containing protein